MKDSQRAHPPAPTTPFVSSVRSGALLSPTHNLDLTHKILSFCSLVHSQWITHVHAHKHITPTQSAVQKQDTFTHSLFSCRKCSGQLQFSTSPLGICSDCFSSGAGQRPLFCNCATYFLWLNVASAAILAELIVISAINPHTSVNKPITSWGQKSPLVSHHRNVQTTGFMCITCACTHEPRLQMGHFSLSWQFTVLQHWTVLTTGILIGTTALSIQSPPFTAVLLLFISLAMGSICNGLSILCPHPSDLWMPVTLWQRLPI